MVELEAKVRISIKQYMALEERLRDEAQYQGERRSEDQYYEQPGKANIRIRKRANEASFDLKLRQTQRGIESNLEMEWGITDLPEWKRTLKKVGLKPYRRKTKHSKIFLKDGFNIELNRVRGLGHFIEIERLVKTKDELGKKKIELISCFKTLGFSQKDFEPKPYLELLNNV